MRLNFENTTFIAALCSRSSASILKTISLSFLCLGASLSSTAVSGNTDWPTRNRCKGVVLALLKRGDQLYTSTKISEVLRSAESLEERNRLWRGFESYVESDDIGIEELRAIVLDLFNSNFSSEIDRQKQTEIVNMALAKLFDRDALIALQLIHSHFSHPSVKDRLLEFPSTRENSISLKSFFDELKERMQSLSLSLQNIDLWMNRQLLSDKQIDEAIEVLEELRSNIIREWSNLIHREGVRVDQSFNQFQSEYDPFDQLDIFNSSNSDSSYGDIILQLQNFEGDDIQNLRRNRLLERLRSVDESFKLFRSADRSLQQIIEELRMEREKRETESDPIAKDISKLPGELRDDVFQFIQSQRNFEERNSDLLLMYAELEKFQPTSGLQERITIEENFYDLAYQFRDNIIPQQLAAQAEILNALVVEYRLSQSAPERKVLLESIDLISKRHVSLVAAHKFVNSILPTKAQETEKDPWLAVQGIDEILMLKELEATPDPKRTNIFETLHSLGLRWTSLPVEIHLRLSDKSAYTKVLEELKIANEGLRVQCCDPSSFQFVVDAGDQLLNTQAGSLARRDAEQSLMRALDQLEASLISAAGDLQADFSRWDRLNELQKFLLLKKSMRLLQTGGEINHTLHQMKLNLNAASVDGSKDLRSALENAIRSNPAHHFVRSEIRILLMSQALQLSELKDIENWIGNLSRERLESLTPQQITKLRSTPFYPDDWTAILNRSSN